MIIKIENYGCVIEPHRDDKTRSTGDYFCRDLVQGTIFDRHDLQLGAESQLKGQGLQVRIVVDVQRLQVLQAADLFRQQRQQVFPHR